MNWNQPGQDSLKSINLLASIQLSTITLCTWGCLQKVLGHFSLSKMLLLSFWPVTSKSESIMPVLLLSLHQLQVYFWTRFKVLWPLQFWTVWNQGNSRTTNSSINPYNHWDNLDRFGSMFSHPLWSSAGSNTEEGFVRGHTLPWWHCFSSVVCFALSFLVYQKTCVVWHGF